MKDLITTVAAIIVLMVFVLQFSANHVIMSRVLQSDRVVDGYRAVLQTRGQTDEEQKRSLIKKLSQTLGCREEEVVLVEGEGSYSISAPIKNIVACGDFLGISQEENRGDYFVSGEYQ